jgi:hypothetical protein
MSDEERYAENVQRLCDNFRKSLAIQVDKAMSEHYQDVIHWAYGDGYTNYANFLRDRLSDEIQKDLLDIEPDQGIYSWAANFRKKLLAKHREELQSAIVVQLEEEKPKVDR